MAQGWIKLHRQLQDCWIWNENEPFDRRSAWVDLLLLANHADKKIMFNGELITIGKGQYLTSVRKLADRWGWGKDKCVKFLRTLETDSMIVKSSDTKKTLLTIVNYSNYQDSNSEVQTPSRHTQVHQTDTDKDTEQTPNRHRQATNNNIKNDNNIKEKDNTKVLSKKKSVTKRFVPPTVEEVAKYCEERNNGIDAEEFVSFYESKGWMIGKDKMVSWKHSVITWEKRRKEEKINVQRNQTTRAGFIPNEESYDPSKYFG